MNTSPKVDFYFEKEKKWQQEIEHLRAIVLGCGLQEELKWGCPCYTDNGVNIVLIHTFKEYCALLFFKGALLKDPHNLLIQQTANVQSARQMRFTSMDEVTNREAIIKEYIRQEIEVEKSGLKVEFKKTEQFAVPEEFQARLDEDPELQKAFSALSPGRQKAYLLNFAQPKQSITRQQRVEKNIPRIMSGKGLMDL